jgi:UDP-N-acetyl-D-galactosamine dehydrogenase
MMEKIAVIGLGYVGLPVALAFARKFPGTVGFDVDATRIAELRDGIDRTHEATVDALSSTSLKFTADLEDLRGITFFVVAVPTPIDAHRRPDLGPVERASATVGKVLAPGAVVVYESTVYPGVTEEICGPILARVSGLARDRFSLGYSPERINPGDPVHRLETITKVVSGEDVATLERVARAYGAIVDAGIHRAPSIKVAEAAKVIENTQRDINIALMNELAVIFERLDIRTSDVLAAARTKWNFLPFSPGLVGGHCIGVDPYYLTARAEQAGYHPQVILSGRRINDDMGRFVASRVIKALGRKGVAARDVRVGILGLTFKENVPDIRNSRVPDIKAELEEFGATVRVHDPRARPDETRHEWGIDLAPLEELTDLHALVLAVGHREYVALGARNLAARLRPDGVFYDVKSVFRPEDFSGAAQYLSL